MKKLLSVLLTAVLALSCSAVTFSATESSATPDEVKKVASIEMTKAPDKTEYILDMVEAGWDYENIDVDPDIDIEDPDAMLELFEQVEFFINVDLTGAEITATYSDGTIGLVDNSLCTTSVADPTSFRAVYEAMMNAETDEDFLALTAMVIREYTINVGYQDASTSFNVNLVEEEYDYESTEYEFVSYTDPHGPVYVIEDDIVEEVIDYDEEDPYIYRYVDFDYSEMTVTVRNLETGELETYGADNIYIDHEFYPEDEIKRGKYTAESAWVMTDSGDFVDFEYNFELVSKKDSGETKPTTDNKTDDKNDTSSKDTPASTKPNDSNAVQTGTPSHAGLLAVVLLSGMFMAFMIYRKKATE